MLCTHSYYETAKIGLCYRQSRQQLHQALTMPSVALPTLHPMLVQAVLLPNPANTADI
jgi:hypothetical protein